jgi:hypothetical protein
MINKFDKYNLINFIKSLNINFNDFNLSYENFYHQSDVHGINHTYRVMFNCLIIGNAIQDKLNTKRAFMAAYIHDMARRHDANCNIHGRLTSEEKLPIYKDIFIKNGMNEDDLKAIKLAVINHSERYEIDKNDPCWKTVAILRDADALDLVRIDVIVKPHLLRFDVSRDLIKQAEELFNKTDWKEYNGFSDFLKKNI